MIMRLWERLRSLLRVRFDNAQVGGGFTAKLWEHFDKLLLTSLFLIIAFWLVRMCNDNFFRQMSMLVLGALLREITGNDMPRSLPPPKDCLEPPGYARKSDVTAVGLWAHFDKLLLTGLFLVVVFWMVGVCNDDFFREMAMLILGGLLREVSGRDTLPGKKIPPNPVQETTGKDVPHA